MLLAQTQDNLAFNAAFAWANRKSHKSVSSSVMKPTSICRALGMFRLFCFVHRESLPKSVSFLLWCYSKDRVYKNPVPYSQDELREAKNQCHFCFVYWWGYSKDHMNRNPLPQSLDNRERQKSSINIWNGWLMTSMTGLGASCRKQEVVWAHVWINKVELNINISPRSYFQFTISLFYCPVILFLENLQGL